MTDRFIRDTKPEARASFYWDDGSGSTKGLGLKVLPSGKKSFVFQYRLGGRASPVKRISLAEPGGTFKIADARIKAGEYRVLIREGRDPAVEIRKARREAEKASTRSFEAVLESFVNEV